MGRISIFWPFGLVDRCLREAAAPNRFYVGSWRLDLGDGFEDFAAVGNYRTRPYAIKLIALHS